MLFTVSYDLAQIVFPFSRRYLFKHFLRGNFSGVIKMALKFVPIILMDNKSALFQLMPWCRTGDKHHQNQSWPIATSHMTSAGHNELTRICC